MDAKSSLSAGCALQILVLVGPLHGSALAAPAVVHCTAWGGSHTSRYTFEVDVSACTLYWREISSQLRVSLCKPPRLEAIKPYAPAKGYVLKFNLETGAFSDHVPGWAERGSCVHKQGYRS